jgi:hypothetical protein
MGKDSKVPEEVGGGGLVLTLKQHAVILIKKEVVVHGFTGSGFRVQGSKVQRFFFNPKSQPKFRVDVSTVGICIELQTSEP